MLSVDSPNHRLGEADPRACGKLNLKSLPIEPGLEHLVALHHPTPRPLPRPSTDTAMLSRTIRRSIASPFRRNVAAPAARPAFRFVTTDAASSHTDKEAVPEVREKREGDGWRCSMPMHTHKFSIDGMADPPAGG